MAKGKHIKTVQEVREAAHKLFTRDCKSPQCTNKSNQGTFVNDYCMPCHLKMKERKEKYGVDLGAWG